MSKKPTPKITRQQAFSARPLAVTVLRRQSLPDGGQRLTIAATPSRFARLILRAPDSIERQFELDSVGAGVFDQCDGSRSVAQIVERFATDHGVDAHEAQRAVTAFLQTLIRKGLVTMAIPREISDA